MRLSMIYGVSPSFDEMMTYFNQLQHDLHDLNFNL